MKRVKLLLTATAVIALVGGALAFKAAKQKVLCLYTSDSASSVCPYLTTTFSFTSAVGGSTTPFRATIEKGTGDCPSTENCSQRADLINEQ
jgi:hypothetical protein